MQFFGADRVVTFMLLFARLSGLIVFFPFYSHNQIPLTVKTALVFVLCVIFYPVAEVSSHSINFLVVEILGEVLLGLSAGLLLNILFAALLLAGEQISMIMGFSMATVLDPQSGANSPIISNIINYLALLTFLAFDGHHILLLFYAHSLKFIPLGDYVLGSNVVSYITNQVVNLFIFGFTLSFPILALSLLSDLIFGMLMKTMPQFNLLVVGYPIKITIAFCVLIAVLAGIMQIFTKLALGLLNDMPSLFFNLK